MRLITALSLVLSTGCLQPAVAVQATNNASIDVEQLFTHDGCRVYRFRDGGYHYFVRCDGAASAATVTPVRCGKHCVRDEAIATDGP